MDEDEIIIIDDGEPTETDDEESTLPADEESVPDVDDDADRPDEDWDETGVEDDANAQQTFTSQPVPPYRAGDLWENSGDTYICVNGKDAGESFAATDWVPAEAVAPTPTTTTRTVTYTELINDFSAGNLANYQARGAVAYAMYDDGTRAQVQWSQVQEPTPTMPGVVANEALIVAQATNQHFWSRATDQDQDGAGTGAFVTDDEQSAFLEAAADGFPDWGDGTQGTKPWHNLLMNSLGILLRTALNNLVSITKSAIAFFDGTGNQAGNVVASFGSNGAQIGKTGESHVELDYRSLKLVDAGLNPYFEVKDLRGADGKAQMTETFDASGRVYDLMFVAAEVTSCTVNGATEGYSTATIQQTPPFTRVTLSTAPQNGSAVAISYKTESAYAKAYTLGTRASGSADGAMSYAEGNNVTASGYASHAEGDRTVAAGRVSHAEGVLTEAPGDWSHAEGASTKATGSRSHAEGSSTTASGQDSHAEGDQSNATGRASHAEGWAAIAEGNYSHAQNERSIALGGSQTVIGRFNSVDQNDEYALIIGNGGEWDDSFVDPDNPNYDYDDEYTHSNALTVDWSGNVECGTVNGADLSQPVADTTASNTIAAASGITLSAVHYVQWGKVAHLMIRFTASSAITVNADGGIVDMDVGTVVSGRRPLTTISLLSWGNNAGLAQAYLNASGKVALCGMMGTGAQRTVAAGTKIDLTGTYILA